VDSVPKQPVPAAAARLFAVQAFQVEAGLGLRQARRQILRARRSGTLVVDVGTQKANVLR
jgi:hypothetical protein